MAPSNAGTRPGERSQPQNLRATTMTGNRIYHFMRPDRVPDYCGPDDLTDALLEARETPSVNRCHLLPTELRDLVRLAFQASVSPEEGRYPRIALYCADDPSYIDQRHSLVRFSAAEPLTAEILRRLAPAFPRYYSALQVAARNGLLYCDGAISTGWSIATSDIGRPEYYVSGRPRPGLRMVVDAPGDLRAAESFVQLWLQGGHLSELTGFSGPDRVHGWLKREAECLMTSLNRRDVPEARERFGGVGGFGRLLSDLWSRILTSAVDRRHGALFVVLPESGWEEAVRFRYPAAPLDLGGNAREFWDSCITASEWQRPIDIQRLTVVKERLFDLTRSVGTLGAVDGCVGVVPGVRIVGFGGEIVASERDSLTSHITFVDARTGEPYGDEAQGGKFLGGMRHRSAFRLCKTIPGTLAFVASQDGGLSLMASDASTIHCFRGLTPRVDIW
jgi:hypothetical protein